MGILLVVFVWFLVCYYAYNEYISSQEKKEKVIVKDVAESRKENNTRQKVDKKKSWSDLRQIVLNKYNYQCSICGSYENLDVHHKIPIKSGGTNELENLIAVCRKCHEKLHKFKLNTEKVAPSDKYGQNIKEKNRIKKGYIILKAIGKKGKLKIRYTTHKFGAGENEITTIRTIRPISLKYGYEITDNEYICNSKYDKNKLFICAFCELRQEMRLFMYDRMEIISVL